MLACCNKQLSYRGGVKYFTRIMTLPNGVEAIVYFEVVLRDGHYVARAVHAEPINSSTIATDAVLAIAGAISRSIITPVKSYFTYLSPFTLKDFTFVTSQPTRAPSFN